MELTEREAQIVRTALEAFFNDFRHEHADLHREIRAVMEKLPAPSDARERPA